ncbi:DegV family protein [Reinekea marina]|uniref:DegV family protein n=2 Tax=Reinekea marina TaxID=1310421 RepID=A0ABV7WSM4_9GAMM|nr:DegV family protein [Reinekea forsetii]
MTTLIVDSACDLPKALIEKKNVQLLPATIIYDKNILQDFRDPEQTISMYESAILNKDHDSESQPTSTKDITRILEQTIANGHTDLVIQTVNRVRSPTYENAVESATLLSKRYASQNVSIRVQDSRTVFTGQAVLAAHTLALIDKGIGGTKLRRIIDSLSSNVHAYQVPADVFYLRERSRKKGDNSISWLGAKVGSLLNISPIVLALDDKTFPVTKIRGFNNAANKLLAHTLEKVEQGLLSPFVCISYAGDPKELHKLAGFNELKLAIKARKYQLITTPMSLSGGVNLGPGTLSVGFATTPYEWKD